MNKTGPAVRIFITAWGETKSIKDWEADHRVHLGRSAIRERYKDFKDKKKNSRWKSPEHFLSHPVLTRKQARDIPIRRKDAPEEKKSFYGFEQPWRKAHPEKALDLLIKKMCREWGVDL